MLNETIFKFFTAVTWNDISFQESHDFIFVNICWKYTSNMFAGFYLGGNKLKNMFLQESSYSVLINAEICVAL